MKQRTAGDASGVIAHRIASALLGLFLLVTMAAPAALLNKVLYVALFAFMLLAPLATEGRVRVSTFSPLFVIVIFMYGYALSFVFHSDRELANQFVLSVALLLLIYLIDWYSVDVERLVKLAGVFLCVFSVGFMLALVLAQNTGVGSLLMDYFRRYSLGAVGERNLVGTTLFTFRIGTAPFLFLPFCLFFDSFVRKRRIRDLAALLIIGLVIALTTSRGLVLGCIFAALFIVTMAMRPSVRIVAGLGAIAVGVLFIDYLLQETNVLSAGEQSNSVKIGHVVSFVDQMNLAWLLIGKGLASYYFTIGFGFNAAHTEITLLDVVRFFGAPLTIVLYGALLVPSLNIKAYGGENFSRLFLFVLYLLISLTNPVLFNSYGLLVVLWYWTSILRGAPTATEALPSHAHARSA